MYVVQQIHYYNLNALKHVTTQILKKLFTVLILADV